MYDEFVHIEVLFITGGGRSAIMGTESTAKIIKTMFKEREEENCITDKFTIESIEKERKFKKSIALLHNHNTQVIIDSSLINKS